METDVPHSVLSLKLGHDCKQLYCGQSRPSPLPFGGHLITLMQGSECGPLCRHASVSALSCGELCIGAV